MSNRRSSFAKCFAQLKTDDKFEVPNKPILRRPSLDSKSAGRLTPTSTKEQLNKRVSWGKSKVLEFRQPDVIFTPEQDKEKRVKMLEGAREYE